MGANTSSNGISLDVKDEEYMLPVQTSTALHTLDDSIDFTDDSDDIREAYRSTDIVVPYQCTTAICDFTAALSTIKASDELKGIKVKQYVEAIVKTIAANPNAFPTLTTGGYIINDNHRTCVIVKNATKGINLRSPKYGVIELNSFRNKLITAAKSRKSAGGILPTGYAMVLGGVIALSASEAWVALNA